MFIYVSRDWGISLGKNENNGMNRQCCVEWGGSLLSSKVSPHVLLRATVLVSGFHAIVSRFHVPHFGFLDSGTLVLDSSRGWIPDSLSCIPGSKAQDSTFQSKTLLFSEFRKQNVRGFRTRPGFQTDFERKKSCKEIPREKTSCSEKIYVL